MPTKQEYEQMALSLISREKVAWQEENVWVSDSSFFSMRYEIDAARKNFFGQFQQAKDTETQLEKMFVPLTEWTVETMVKNVDLDLKDVQFKSPEAKYNTVAATMGLIVRSYLKKLHFGEILNDIIRNLCVDGTSIVKVFNAYSKEFKRNILHIRRVSPLAFIVDPTINSLQEGTVIEKSEMTMSEVARHTDWDNVKKINWTDRSVPTTIVFERWGKIPKSYVTGEESDKDIWVEGVIIASGNRYYDATRAPENQRSEIDVIHKIMLNKTNMKPYEECWLKRVPGRWHGRGIPEQLRGLQTWLNTVVNIRRDELLNKLGGTYKIRKGTGITRQMLESLRAGGAIPVDDMDDIQELRTQDVKASAYQEPNDIVRMADRVTGAFEMARGETLPSAMPATTAVLQERGARSTFTLVQENIGLFLERLIKRHIIPIVIQNLKEEEIIRITGEPEDLNQIDEAQINFFLNKAIVDYRKRTKRHPSFLDVRRLRLKAQEQMRKFGKDRYVKIAKNIFNTEYDVEVYVTAEKFDKAVIVKQLQDLLFTYSRIPGTTLDVNAIMKEVLDIMGISGTRFTKPTPDQPQLAEPGVPTGQTPTPQTEFQRGNLEGTLSPAAR